MMTEGSLLSKSSTGQLDKFVCEHIGPVGVKMVPFTSSGLFHGVSLVLCVVNGLLCPVTVIGNLLVFAAVLRKADLRNVANTSILCLAFTDLMVGFFVEPSYIIYQTSKQTSEPDNFPCKQLLVYSFLGVICICMSFLTLILISLERYLAVFYPYRYIEKISPKRVVAVCGSVWAISITVLLAIRFSFGINSSEETTVISLVIFTNFLVTSFVYIKIFRLVKRCNAQVNVEMPNNNLSSQNAHPQPQMHLNQREAKASKTVAFVAGTLFLCFVPTFCVTIVDQTGLARKDLLYHLAYPIAETAVLLNSCLNPGIYVWRSRGIRQSLVELLRSCRL